MTAKKQLDLPEIPSLPPISMPESSAFYRPSSSLLGLRHTQFSESRSGSPSSPDTFQTARGTPTEDGVPSPLEQQREQDVTPRTFIPHLPSESSSSRSHGAARERPGLPPARSDFASGGVLDERDMSSFLEDSDTEQGALFARRTRKGKSIQRHPVPLPGELGLPSRLQTMNSVPDIGVSQSPAPIVPARSSSLNHKVIKQKASMSVNTHIATPSMSEKSPVISIAVVGAAGCGKSTVVRKGLKGYGLGEPETVRVMETLDPGAEPFTYTLRTGKISVNRDTPERVLRVLEVDASSLRLSERRPVWPETRPRLDGLLVCYSAASEDSFAPVEAILDRFSNLKLPTVVLACKSDIAPVVDPNRALTRIQSYDVGLVRVTNADGAGKDKMRHAFEWIFKAVFYALEDRGGARTERDGYRNPASPAVLGAAAPWDISRASSATPTAATAVAQFQFSSTSPSYPLQTPQSHPPETTPTPARGFHISTSSVASSEPPVTPTSPSRTRSTSDLVSESEKSKREQWEQNATVRNVSVTSPTVRSKGSLSVLSNAPEAQTPHDEAGSNQSVTKDSRLQPWMTLDELLNKLLFMAVSNDDPVFVSHFLLTYRRFASPRSILLAMQKRMRALDGPTGDPMFACYAQMRICLLLDMWIRVYPNDFAVPGAYGALTAVVKASMTKTYLLHYASDFQPFLEIAQNLRDPDKPWALKIEDESDVMSVLSDEENYVSMENESSVSSDLSHFPIEDDLALGGLTPGSAMPHNTVLARERKASLPLTARALIGGSPAAQAGVTYAESNVAVTIKQQLKHLVSWAQELNAIDPTEIAQEITRVEAKFFLQIEPRHWLHHVLVAGRKDPEFDTIARYNHVSNHIATWVVSFILCHDKAKHRCRQIEKFVEVANRLRSMHNYSALRAIIAGVNGATFEGDPSLEMFKTRSPELWKNFQSWDQLLQSVRSHQKYRMALRNTPGPCIPALEIHLSDLIRAHEGNSDYHDDDPNKIHWAKFNMMARFIDAITHCQKGCRESTEYDFTQRPHISKLCLLYNEEYLMDTELQRSRIAPPDSEGEDGFGAPVPRAYIRDLPSQPKEPQILRKIFGAWAG